MIELFWQFDDLVKLQTALTAMPDVLTTRFEKAARSGIGIFHDDLAQYAEPPNYPIIWDSERQRRAFFATDGFGGGIPHTRAGALPDSWQTEVNVSENELMARVFTPEDWAKYVQDSNQQSAIHAGRWQNTTQGVLEKDYEIVVKGFVTEAEIALDQVSLMLD